MATASDLFDPSARRPVGVPQAGDGARQARANGPAAAGGPVPGNSLLFLWPLPRRRGPRGIRDIVPGTLLVIDEASMMSMPDLAEIVAHAASRGAKVVIAGDQE